MITTLPEGFRPNKILVCQQRQIGDVLLATPSVRILADRFPDAELHFLTEKKCVQILENNPRISRVWTIDKNAGLADAATMYFALRRERFDITIDFQQLIRLRLASFICGADIRLSYPPKWYNKIFYNASHPFGSGYAAKAKSGVLGFFGIQWDGKEPEIYLSDAERTWARLFMANNGVEGAPFLTIDPTHRRITRKWPGENYAALIKLLLEKCPKLRIFLLYGPGEKDEVSAIRQMAGNHDRCLVTEHMTTLREMCAIQEIATGHIGNCSSPRHTAVAVGTPTLTILGSTKPAAWRFPSDAHINMYNKDLPCIGCNSNECRTGTLQCLLGVTPQSVFNQAVAHFQLA